MSAADYENTEEHLSRSLSDPVSRFWYLRLRSDESIVGKALITSADSGKGSSDVRRASDYENLLAVELYFPNLPFERHMNRRMLGIFW